MIIAELHPEDLFDKEILGKLTSDERARLESHVKSCSACRFVRQARSDFQRDFESIEHATKDPGMLSLAMRVGAPSAHVAPPGSPRGRKLQPLLLVAAALLLIVTGAAAAEWLEGKRLSSPSPRARGGVVAGAPVAPESAPLPRALPLGSAASQAPRVAAATTPVSPHPVTTSPSRVEPKVQPAEGLARASQLAVSNTASSLFEEANEARRDANYGTAITLYRQIDERFPRAPETPSSEVILGRLLLDRGDPDDALRRFDAYLARGGGPLREEALVGRAATLRQLGRDSAERAAWARLRRVV